MEPAERKRVLLVDDDGVTRSVLAKMLGARGFEVIEAESGGAALRALSLPDAPRMAVVDWNMGTINGPELCRMLRSRSPYVYVVLTTAREGRKPLIEAMNSGADGYLQKPVDPDEIEAWLVAGQRIVALQDRLLAIQAELEELATVDALTGVRNRRSLMELLERELKRTRRTNQPTGIVIIDVDHFKSVNDRHGHPVGDEVLVEVARRCRRAVRDYDVFGRLGGEEFVAILPGANTRSAEAAGVRLIGAIAAQPIKTSAGDLEITASAGATSTEAGHLDDEEIVAAADGALYAAKKAGRACVRVASGVESPPSDEFGTSEPDTMKAPSS